MGASWSASEVRDVVSGKPLLPRSSSLLTACTGLRLELGLGFGLGLGLGLGLEG